MILAWKLLQTWNCASGILVMWLLQSQPPTALFKNYTIAQDGLDKILKAIFDIIRDLEANGHEDLKKKVIVIWEMVGKFNWDIKQLNIESLKTRHKSDYREGFIEVVGIIEKYLLKLVVRLNMEMYRLTGIKTYASQEDLQD